MLKRNDPSGCTHSKCHASSSASVKCVSNRLRSLPDHRPLPRGSSSHQCMLHQDQDSHHPPHIVAKTRRQGVRKHKQVERVHRIELVTLQTQAFPNHSTTPAPSSNRVGEVALQSSLFFCWRRRGLHPSRATAPRPHMSSSIEVLLHQTLSASAPSLSLLFFFFFCGRWGYHNPQRAQPALSSYSSSAG